MITISGDKFVYFDVDDTLVDWNRRDTESSLLFQQEDGTYWALEPKWDIVRKLKEHKRNGDTVIVWSQGGWHWCNEIVTVMNLTSYVDAVMSKPHQYYDDLNCKEFMTNWVKV